MSLKKGFIHVYTGPGKGKTTAALGLGLRATGAGYKVYMIQFMKGRRYNEINSLDNIPNFNIVQYGRDEFVNKNNPEKIDIDLAKKGFNHAKEIIESKKYDIVILDEINVAIDFNLIKLEDLLKIINEKPESVELVLTGRYANSEIIKLADIVTEMLEIKHPYHIGIEAREGIDF